MFKKLRLFSLGLVWKEYIEIKKQFDREGHAASNFSKEDHNLV